jgi:transposase, IS30 family
MRSWGDGQGRRLRGADHEEIHRRLAAGETQIEVGAAVGCSERSIRRLINQGWQPKRKAASRSPSRLSCAEREELSRGLQLGNSLRSIAAELGRAPSTISREVKANGKRHEYRAFRAEQTATGRNRRPRARKLASNIPLRQEVERRLLERWSPQQIAARLICDYPLDVTMRVSHETIYQSLFVQARGTLGKELTAYLRTGRIRRKPHGRDVQRGRMCDMTMIADRPPEAADRAVPGHWEGDLIIGKNGKSAIGTLVERRSRFVMLLPLPLGRSAEHVRQALTQVVHKLPQELRRSLTWDQGKEMAEHAQFSVDTNVKVFFCDPHSPWQRGSNENTNGLLRQYFPKGADLHAFTQAELAAVANELNSRPRQSLAWMKPSEVFGQVVASTA